MVEQKKKPSILEDIFDWIETMAISILTIVLIFTLLYTPCIAAIACIKRELGSKKAAFFIVLMQCAIAWIVSFIIHSIGILLGFA